MAPNSLPQSKILSLESWQGAGRARWNSRITRALELHGLDPIPFRVAHYLRFKAYKTGRCTASLASMEKATRLSHSSVWRSLRLLEANHIVVRESNIGAPDIYVFNHPNDWTHVP